MPDLLSSLYANSETAMAWLGSAGNPSSFHLICLGVFQPLSLFTQISVALSLMYNLMNFIHVCQIYMNGDLVHLGNE